MKVLLIQQKSFCEVSVKIGIYTVCRVCRLLAHTYFTDANVTFKCHVYCGGAVVIFSK